MIQLNKYIKFLLESKMTLELAASIFAKYGYDVSKMSKKDLRKAWADLSNIYHPDKGGDVEIMKDINTAYETLKNSVISWSSCNGVLVAGINSVVSNNLITNTNYHLIF